MLGNLNNVELFCGKKTQKLTFCVTSLEKTLLYSTWPEKIRPQKCTLKMK